MQYCISASLLSANFAKLGEACDAVLQAGADRIHLDIMDNHYVPNLTVGPLVCQALRDYGVTATIDVHLMTTPVDSLIEQFAKAGADLITFHPEATLHIDRSLQLVKDLGCQAGLAFNPATPLDCLKYVFDKVDEILLMSVNPGFGGQAFIPATLTKIAEVKALLQQQPYHIRLAVDGGVKVENISAIAWAGADTFIIGSALFSSKNYTETLAAFRQKLQEAHIHKGE